MIPETGDRIRLIEMGSDPDPIPPGSTGTVTSVTTFEYPVPSSSHDWEDGKPVGDPRPGPDIEAQVHVDWDGDRSLILLVPVDRFEIEESL